MAQGLGGPLWEFIEKLLDDLEATKQDKEERIEAWEKIWRPMLLGTKHNPWYTAHQATARKLLENIICSMKGEIQALKEQLEIARGQLEREEGSHYRLKSIHALENTELRKDNDDLTAKISQIRHGHLNEYGDTGKRKGGGRKRDWRKWFDQQTDEELLRLGLHLKQSYGID